MRCTEGIYVRCCHRKCDRANTQRQYTRYTKEIPTLSHLYIFWYALSHFLCDRHMTKYTEGVEHVIAQTHRGNTYAQTRSLSHTHTHTHTTHIHTHTLHTHTHTYKNTHTHTHTHTTQVRSTIQRLTMCVSLSVSVCLSVCVCMYVTHIARTYEAKATDYGALAKHMAVTHTPCNTLYHDETHCNTLQRPASHCNTLQRHATHCTTMKHTATHCMQNIARQRAALQRTAIIWQNIWP